MRGPGLSRGAYLYVLGSVAVAAVAITVATVRDPRLGDLAPLAVYAVGAALAQLFLVQASPRLGYDISLAFLFAAVISLPAPAVVLVATLMFLPVWAREKYPWYMPIFNMANYAIPALIAQAIVGFGPSEPGVVWALWVALATIVFTLVNHAVLAGILKLARGESIRETRLFTFTHLSLDSLVLCSGSAIALSWAVEPLTSLFAMLPLILIARALQIPRLEQESWTDPKTGLYNARFFSERGEEIVERGQGLTSLAMIDLDFLREINNTYGHLAGDDVIAAVARMITADARATDMAARFGGEEFALLMPSTTLESAAIVADRIRASVADMIVPTEGERLTVTVSIGVASGPGTLEELIRRADRALYRAKERGRNVIVLADELDEADHPDRVERRTRAGARDTQPR
jgi:diguanylate cyclase (GGDEF)-like protein